MAARAALVIAGGDGSATAGYARRAITAVTVVICGAGGFDGIRWQRGGTGANGSGTGSNGAGSKGQDCQQQRFHRHISIRHFQRCRW